MVANISRRGTRQESQGNNDAKTVAFMAVDESGP
jgi:hypothetical protein